MGWLNPYLYRRAIYANTSSLAGTETNIPLPLFAPDLTGKVLANFNDAVITDTDGETLLDYYWESKTAAAGIGSIKIPSLTAGQAALPIGYLYYGNNSASDQSDEVNTFSALSARYGLAEA